MAGPEESGITWPLVLFTICHKYVQESSVLGSVKDPVNVTRFPSLTVWSSPACAVGGILGSITVNVIIDSSLSVSHSPSTTSWVPQVPETSSPDIAPVARSTQKF